MTEATISSTDARSSDSSPKGALCNLLWHDFDASSPPAKQLPETARSIVVVFPSDEKHEQWSTSEGSADVTANWGLMSDLDLSIQLDLGVAYSETRQIRQDPELMQTIRDSQEAIDEGQVRTEEEAHEMIGW